MKSIEYYLDQGRHELEDGLEVICTNGTIERIGGDLYISRGMLSDCSSCKNYSGNQRMICALHPNYRGLNYCEDYEQVNNTDSNDWEYPSLF